MLIVVVPLMCAGLGALYYYTAGRIRRHRAALAFVAKKAGLHYDAGDFLKRPKVTGAVTSGAVTLCSRGHFVEGESVLSTCIVLRADDLPQGLSLHKETLFGGKDVELGEYAFDKAVAARGPPDLLLAHLDEAARRLAVQAVGRDGITVQGGRIEFAEAGVVTDRRRLLALVQQMDALALALCGEGQNIPERLLEAATTDPEPGIRRRASRLLWSDYSTSPQAQRWEAEALEADDPWVRLEAAKWVGATMRGMEALMALAGDGALAPKLRARAVDIMPGGRGPDCARQDADAIQVLRGLLPTVGGPLLVAVLTALQRYDALAPLDVLEHRAVAVARGARFAIAVAAARHGGAATSLLVRLLTDDEEVRVQIAAARGLGRSADLDAVLALLPHASGVFGNDQLKRAARGAIEAIQARAGVGESGGLSLVADAEGGALGGALSQLQSTGEAGQLSQAAPQDAPLLG